MQPVILLHGGVRLGGKSAARRDQTIDVMKNATRAGYKRLISNGSAVDGVETAINIMEESGILNAGLGAVIQADGKQRMDASIMRSNPLKAGAVASLRGILHPISVARQIMENTPNVMFAEDFAKDMALTWGDAQLPEKQRLQKKKPSKGNTVGSVALDSNGILAAGTSTGGLSNSPPGRIGDSPIIGAGTYANHFGAASATGIGENILKLSITRLTTFYLEFNKLSPQASVDRALEYYKSYFDSILGLIVLDTLGHWGVGFIGQEMPWAVAIPAGPEQVEIRVGLSLQDFATETMPHSKL